MTQEDKPSCRRKCCLEISHACTWRELQTSSLSQCQNGPMPPAVASLLFSRSSHSTAGMERRSLLLHSPLPEARKSQFASASAQPSSGTGTPSLKPRLEALGPRVTPSPQQNTAGPSRTGYNSGLSYRAQFTSDLLTFTLARSH